jgi:general secretion pathway protein G
VGGRSGRALARGFTLVELLVVMAIIATLLSIVVPRYIGSVDSAREAALKSTLARMRDAIDQYHADRGNYPATLERTLSRSLPIPGF